MPRLSSSIYFIKYTITPITAVDKIGIIIPVPAKPTAIGVLNGANLLELALKGMATMAPEAALPPLRITTKDPVFFSGGFTGKAQHVIVYVPSKLIMEIVQNAMMIGMSGGGGGGQDQGPQPVPPSDDF